MALVHTVYNPGVPGADPLPTVVAIHGHGANGLDLLGLAPYLAPGVLVICPEAEFTLQPGMLSYTWFDTIPPARRTPEQFERTTAVLRDFIAEAVPRYGGDPARTALLGFSQGGTLAYRLGLAEPERYRGVAALSTWFPDEAEEHADRAHLGRLPLLVQHGTEDVQIDVERARQSRDRLHLLGANLDYREYPMGHEIRPEGMSDLAQWLIRVLELNTNPWAP